MLSTRVMMLAVLGLFKLIASAQIQDAGDIRTFGQERLTDGDPFELVTGIYYREYTDLVVKDSIPINLVRTHRNMDPRSRSFGVGASTSYDMFIIGDTAQFSWVALVLANGSRVRYSRISPGTHYYDGIFEDKSDPSEFLGSRIFWNAQGSWTVTLRDGREYRVQACGSTSKPGQCAITEIKNAQGERLVIQRDPEGNILRITSPHGHFVEMKNDSSGRILRTQDDLGKWVNYTYDDKGCLIRTQNWRGDRQQFRYDARFNMTYIHEAGPNGSDGKGPYDFTITNRFDKQDHVVWQRVSTGQIFSATYHQDAQGRIRQTDVKDNISLARYFFDELGYQYKEEFQVANHPFWVLEYVHEPTTRQILDVTLSCPAGKKHLSPQFAETVAEMGEAHKYYVSELCRRASKTKSPPPSSSGQ